MVALGASSVFETQALGTGEAGKWTMGEDFDPCNSCVVVFVAEWELLQKAEGCDQHFLPVCCHFVSQGSKCVQCTALLWNLCSRVCDYRHIHPGSGWNVLAYMKTTCCWILQLGNIAQRFYRCLHSVILIVCTYITCKVRTHSLPNMCVCTCTHRNAHVQRHLLCPSELCGAPGEVVLHSLTPAPCWWQLPFFWVPLLMAEEKNFKPLFSIQRFCYLHGHFQLRSQGAFKWGPRIALAVLWKSLCRAEKASPVIFQRWRNVPWHSAAAGAYLCKQKIKQPGSSGECGQEVGRKKTIP